MNAHFYTIRFLCCLLVYLARLPVFGQEKSPHLLSVKPTTDFDQRFYYTNGEKQNVWGYRIGAIINEKYKLGVGGYYMNRKTEVPVHTTPLTRTAAALTLHKKLYLGSIYYEPYLLRRRLWETSLIVETGYGRTVNYTSGENHAGPVDKRNSALVTAGAGLSVNLKPPILFKLRVFRWIGINAMAGYRTAVYQQDKQYMYNGAYWSISGALFLDKIVEDYRYWKKQRTRSKKQATLNF